MNERDLFLSALEIEDPAARQAHLQAACGDNGELLSRVESLLASHQGESQFLQTPVGEQLGEGPTGSDATLVMGTGSTQDDEPGDGDNGVSVLEFKPNQERVNMSDEIPLGYLEPSTRPGSLGRLGHYEILEVIGQGAFGTVLRAFDDKLQRVVAIKVMAAELAATSPARKRFLREAQSSAQIRHENVVSVYAVEEKPIPYLVMEYIPGQTLQQKLDEKGPLDVPTCLRLGMQIAEGLAAAHAKDLIHRDVKPGNILLESGMRDRVKITDFGLARAADDASMTQSGVIAGTPMYMAPEQALGHKLDQRADLFSFGSVLYQMVSGRPPFRASSTLAVLKRLTEDTARPIREIIPETPTWLCDIIAKLHAKNPDERYQSAREIADVLANCESQLKEHSRLKDLSLIPRVATKPSGWWKWIAAAAIAAVILPLIAGGIYALTRPRSKPIVDVSAPRVVVKSSDGEEIAGWGKVVDPKRDCSISSTKDSLTITVPGGEHNLNPTPAFNDISAPRVLRQAEGDFELEARLDAFPPPETGTASVVKSYVGAGLVLWQDDKNFVRFLRAANGATGIVFVHFEHFQNGALANTKAMNLPNQPLSLRVVRTGDQFRLLYELEGGQWTEMKLDAPVQLAGKLEAGIFATSSTKQPFTTRFSQCRFQPKAGSSADGWVELFNGKDLSGWQTIAGRPSDWKVKDGVLTGRGPVQNYLYSTRGTYRDFHLRAEARINDGGNSGIHFHVALPDPRVQGAPRGYEVQIAGPADVNATGSLMIFPAQDYLLAHVANPPVDSNTWFTQEIISRGRRIIVKVNDQVLVDQEHAGPEVGHLALQAFEGDTKVDFRRIEIKELPPEESKDEGASRIFANNEWIDVIPLIDPRLDRHGNKLTGRNAWRVDNGELVVGYADEKPSKLLLPLDSDWKAFECELDFTRRTGASALGLNIPVKQSDVPLIVDLTGRQVTLGRRAVIGEIGPIQNGERAKFTVRARKQDGTDHLEVTVNGKSVGTWTGNRSIIEGISGEGYAHARRLSFWIPGGSEYVFHQIRIRMLDGGTAETLRPVMSATNAPPLAIAPFDAVQAKAHQAAWAKHLGVPLEITNSIGMKFRLIPPGEFLMGSTAEEIQASIKAIRQAAPADVDWQKYVQSESPQHKVLLTQPFYLGVHEVTQRQYEEVMGSNPSRFAKTGQNPELVAKVADLDTTNFAVDSASWTDAAEFCAKLSQREKLKPVLFRAGNAVTKLAGNGYRLPTEAEWEFACRAGTTTKYSNGNSGDSDLLPSGWFWSNAGLRMHAVGELKANPFGLFDMHGNASEFVEDTWALGYYEQLITDPATDPAGAPVGEGEHTKRIQRGGFWASGASESRSGSRFANDQLGASEHVGFRVALPVEAVKAAAVSNHEPLPPTFKNTLGMEFVIVPKGKSWLGGGKDKQGDKEVEIPADFYLGKYEVTQEEWEKVMGENPSHFSRTGDGKDAVKDIPDADLKRFPVENVSWDQCQIFVAKLNKLKKETGWVYRLPKEAEWEYACRGGPMADKLDSAFDFYFAKPTNALLMEQANFDFGRGLKRTCKVGSYEANRLGLCDLHGDVWEWCNDTVKAINGDSERVTRSGGWQGNPDDCRAANRGSNTPSFSHFHLGLRLARVPADAASPEAKTLPLAVAPFTNADVQRIAALPATEQVEEVRKELMRRNPNFDGKFEHKIEDGVVTEIHVVTDNVADISPLRVFNALRVLDCSGTEAPVWHGNGQLADLTPLKGMNLAGLKQLNLEWTQVGDAGLSCFKDCKNLTHLRLWGSRVGDAGMANFKDCKSLTGLWLGRTKVSNAGLVYFQNCQNLEDLGLPGTQVDDTGLAYFKDCKRLKGLDLSHTLVTHTGLACFKDCKALMRLYLGGTKVTDLSPLKEMPLKELWCDFQPERDAESLRSIKTLETINGKPAAEFWKEVEQK